MRCKPALLINVAVATVVIFATLGPRPLMGQRDTQGPGLVASLGVDELTALAARCGETEPSEATFEAVRKHAFSRRRSGPGEIVAFEENRWFVYAMADMSSGGIIEKDAWPQRLRRIWLLKPSTLVVEDVIRSTGPESSIRWMLRSATEPKIDSDRFRLTQTNTEILGETVLPDNATLKTTARPARGDRPAGFRVEVTPVQAAKEVRFLHVFHVGRDAGDDAPARPKVARERSGLELTVPGPEGVFRLTWPNEATAAGKIELSAADGKALVSRRLLPSGVMPHGPKGAELMERWDAPYRGERMPGWDVGAPCTHLVRAVEDKTFKPGRAIVLGCGSGTNAIYLASEGFEVSGVDVSPSALAIAAEKARRAGVKVEWILADVVALPKLSPYDLIFDRGCYHHICQYDSPGYVETLRRLSAAGSRAMILAGSPADGNRGGPPRIKKETIQTDFSTLFDFEWLRDIHFDSRGSETTGPSAWSIHLRRKE